MGWTVRDDGSSGGVRTSSASDAALAVGAPACSSISSTVVRPVSG